VRAHRRRLQIVRHLALEGLNLRQANADHAIQWQRKGEPAAGQVHFQFALDGAQNAHGKLLFDHAQKQRFLALQAEAEEGLAIIMAQALALQDGNPGGPGTLDDVDPRHA